MLIDISDQQKPKIHTVPVLNIPKFKQPKHLTRPERLTWALKKGAKNV